MASSRNTIVSQGNRRNKEIAENFAILFNTLLIGGVGLFIPLPFYIVFLISYGIGFSVYTVFKETIDRAMFRFFDSVASFFGYPPPPSSPAPLPSFHDWYDWETSPSAQSDIVEGRDTRFLNRRLRSSSDPALIDPFDNWLAREEFKELHYQRREEEIKREAREEEIARAVEVLQNIEIDQRGLQSEHHVNWGAQLRPSSRFVCSSR